MAGDIGVGQFVTDVCKCPIEPGACIFLGVEPVAAVESTFWLLRDLVGSLRKISRQQQSYNLDREVGKRETERCTPLALVVVVEEVGSIKFATPLQKIK